MKISKAILLKLLTRFKQREMLTPRSMLANSITTSRKIWKIQTKPNKLLIAKLNNKRDKLSNIHKKE